ncbi:MAG: hypothetical protein AB8H79_05985 [Myxococcota bacterium]
MNKTLFVAGLSWRVNDESLTQAFAAHPALVRATVLLDPETQRSFGFGFVAFSDADSADRARVALHGQDVRGRPIRVTRCNERVVGENGEELAGIGLTRDAYKWVMFVDGTDALYDLSDDPAQRVNLIEDPAYLEVTDSLRDEALYDRVPGS